MDETDREILEILKKDGRASYTAIANEVGVSEGTVRNRVENMQESGVIERFTVEVEEPAQSRAFISVDVSTERGFDEIIEEFPENLEIYEIAGDMDMLVYISRESPEQVNDAVDSIREVNGVEGTQTYMVLSEKT